MDEKEKMLAGLPYLASDPELRALFQKARRLTRQYNQTTEEESDERDRLLRELLGATGNSLYIEPPFRCDYGCNIAVGERFYANFDCIVLDVCNVTIGKNVMLGPRVCIYTAAHPIDAVARVSGLEYGKPVAIGGDVWIGGNTVINPGVRVGSNVVIGSGSVLTKDVPDGVVAAGNPCRVLRRITEQDQKDWEAQCLRLREFGGI